jgi:two-component system sensor histidine kinase KdpD
MRCGGYTVDEGMNAPDSSRSHEGARRSDRTTHRDYVEMSPGFSMTASAAPLPPPSNVGSSRLLGRAGHLIRRAAERRWLRHAAGYGVTFGFVVLATGAASLLEPHLPLHDLSLVYLMAVLFSAHQFGLWPALFGVLLSVNAYNYFFIPPRLTFRIDDPADAAALIFYSVVAIVVSNLTAQSRRQMRAIAEHSRVTEELYAFARRMTGIVSVDALLPVVAYRIAGMFRCNVAIMLPSPKDLAVRAAYPPELPLDATDIAAARRCVATGEPGSRETAPAGAGERQYLPMRTAEGMDGAVVIDRQQHGAMSEVEHRLLAAVVDQTAVAIERLHLVEDIEGARREAEGEKLRNAVLTAISHDLRTPLSGIIGALGSLSRAGEHHDEAARQELTAVALEEAQRLDRFVGNMLDMAKLQTGAVKARLEAVDLADVVSEAIRHAGSLLRQRRLAIELPDDLPFAMADPVLLERVVFNLLDNAAKHTPAAATISVSAAGENGEVVLQVADEGLGLSSLPKAATIQHPGREPARRPSGLGLSISRGFMQAMGGSIDGANRTDRRGAVFTMRLPAAAPPPDFEQ